MQQDSVTINLLDYYAELASHHRIMMVGFATVYFFINQALLLTPLSTLEQSAGRVPFAIVLSAGLLTIFTIAATMHHACHLCANAGMKAVMSADLHFIHLPDNRDDMDEFETWISGTANKTRQALAVPTASVVILGVAFLSLGIVNSYIYLGICRALLDNKDTLSYTFFGGFVVLILCVAIFYLVIFSKHFKYFQDAKRELAVVLNSQSKADVLGKIEKFRPSGKQSRAALEADSEVLSPR
ncbi:hypothetical protein [Roseateles toxinivorans]|uniref:hypothetical protein n=1 Tax=Roseateles toxinivorans TaxID=270368 RepID=UPI00105F04D3|nr:hypothetical protein [Roseateles toxinivorans]